MLRTVELPPEATPRPSGSFAGGWWSETEDGRLFCELCPRACTLNEGDRGFCFVRQNVGGEILLTTYGRSTGFCIDPIEKKPLNHFLPGTSVLSFGTAGCNLGCRFCQNWDISKSREVERLSEMATPEMIAAAARELACASVAFTYNDPVVWAEYAIDTARVCRDVGVKTVAVTAGYISPAARQPFFEWIDAANVDLKAFDEEFYYRLTASHLEPVLETLKWLKRETDVWFEITNLIIPDANDSPTELKELCDWVLAAIGDDTPIHFTAFHPDFRMNDRPPTPLEKLLEAHDIATRQGLKHVYVGNVDDARHQSTYCSHCGELLIERNWYSLGAYHLERDRCGHCQGLIAGRFDERPGDWGRRRLPVRIADFAAPGLINTSSDPPNSELKTMTTPDDNSTAAAPTTEMGVSTSPQLSAEQEQLIHQAACEIVASQVQGRPLSIADETLGGAAGQMVMGAFVTLKRKGQLRSCCGLVGVEAKLSQAIGHASKRTAVDDNRFPPISPIELKHLDLDVTLLFAFEPIEDKSDERIAAVEIGKHGLQIQRGSNSGLLLPSVATEHGFTAQEFLQQVSRKAGLPTNAWRDDNANLVRFEGKSVSGKFDESAVAELETPLAYTAEQTRQLAEHCRANLLLLHRGGTPNSYLPGGADGNVRGVLLTISVAENEEPVRVGNLTLRNNLPLQSSLFSMCQTAANGLRNIALDENTLTVDVAIASDTAMHGTLEAADLTDFAPARRSLLVAENGRNGWCFQPSSTAAELLSEAADRANSSMPQVAQVFSFATHSSAASAEFSNVAKPFVGPEDRAPAVAGAFYPADQQELDEMLDGFLDSNAEREACPAIMAPHAGLVYSGKIAGSVFGRVQIPETVIVIGPKHTNLGVEWAVAPHQKWQVPGGVVHSDPQLAQQLVDAIPGLQMDAAAHAREHAIEVELPFIKRLAPDAKVVGVALGGGNLERVKSFAQGLAKVIKSMDEPPLLVISSDMNHYAPDEENRRLDDLALTALESLDAEELLTTCGKHNISMCGVLPAAIVLETLRELGQLNSVEKVAYATSADVSGDKSRVVGYAAAILR